MQTKFDEKIKKNEKVKIAQRIEERDVYALKKSNKLKK